MVYCYIIFHTMEKPKKDAENIGTTLVLFYTQEIRHHSNELDNWYISPNHDEQKAEDRRTVAFCNLLSHAKKK